MGKKSSIYIFKEDCEWVFETRKNAAEFLNCSITSMVYNEKLGQRVKGYKVVFKKLSDGCCRCGRPKSSKDDDYCNQCYYIEATGKTPQGEGTPMGLNERRADYNPQKRI